MSFLVEATSRRVATASRFASRTNFASTASRASFTTSLRLQKTTTESVKDTIKSADKAAANKVADGIDASGTWNPPPQRIPKRPGLLTDNSCLLVVEAKNKVKEAVSGKAPEIKGQAAGKAEELKGQAAGKAEELKGKAKGKVNEL